MTKPKLLWCGDIVATTGFARVTENVLARLKDNFDIAVLGHNWWGDPTPLSNEYRLYPSSNRFQTAPFGEQRIREIVEREKPDIVFTINDMWIINEQYRQIQDLHQQGAFKFVGYAPMDSYNWIGCLNETANSWDAVISYTEFGAHEFIAGGIKKPVAVIPHGVTPGQFYPIDKAKAREQLGIDKDKFVVFNGNRNQFRKRLDITIQAFAKFCKDKPDAQLYLHMGMKDQGWDILPLFAREMEKQGVDPNGRIILTTTSASPPSVSVEELNVIYNACDVGLNTCKGEGFGLVNFEHAACRVAQVVPNHTSCKELFEGYGRLIRTEHVDVDTNYARELPCPSADHLAEILNDLYEHREKLDATAELCYQRATDPQFAWDTVASQFGGIFEDVLNEVDHTADAPPIAPKRRKNRKQKQEKQKELAAV